MDTYSYYLGNNYLSCIITVSLKWNVFYLKKVSPASSGKFNLDIYSFVYSVLPAWTLGAMVHPPGISIFKYFVGGNRW